MKSLSMRTRFKGEISGILSMIDSSENRNKVIVNISKEMKEAAKGDRSDKFQQNLWRITALIIATEGNINYLLCYSIIFINDNQSTVTSPIASTCT